MPISRPLIRRFSWFLCRNWLREGLCFLSGLLQINENEFRKWSVSSAEPVEALLAPPDHQASQASDTVSAFPATTTGPAVILAVTVSWIFTMQERVENPELRRTRDSEFTALSCSVFSATFELADGGPH